MDRSERGTDVTELLGLWRAGDDSALDDVMPRLYDVLRRLAGRLRRDEQRCLTLDTRDLVHEAFLRMVAQRHVDWRSRDHFFAIAAQMMRRILIDHARKRMGAKRGGGWTRLPLESLSALAGDTDLAILSLNAALEELEGGDPELGRIVELRFFGGLGHGEIAGLLGLSIPTVQRRWRLARAWLLERLEAPGVGDVVS